MEHDHTTLTAGSPITEMEIMWVLMVIMFGWNLWMAWQHNRLSKKVDCSCEGEKVMEDPFAPLPTPPGNNSHPPGNDRELAISIETSVRDGLLANLMERVQNYKNWESYNEEQRSALMRYRQDLIDVTDQEGFPYYIVWPQPPF